MMALPVRNTSERYGLLSVGLHWVLAALIIGMLAVGLWMDDLEGPFKLQVYGWHKATGIAILALVCLRLGWRLAQVVPRLPQDMPRWQQLAAKTSHWALYGAMFAMPLSGWLMSSAAGFPVSFFGLFVVPSPIGPNPLLKSLFKDIHEVLGFTLIALIAAHAGAALYHHTVRKDGVLKGMLPW